MGNEQTGGKKEPRSRLQLLCAIGMNVQLCALHAALAARRAWPSFSCRCVSTGEACQTPGSPSQRCQRTFQVLSGAGRENKGGRKNKGWGGEEECLWLGGRKKRVATKKMTRSKWILFGRFGSVLFCSAWFCLQKAAQIDTKAEKADGRVRKRYLQSGSVHVSRQLSSPSTGDHEHFIGVHLQRETRVSAHATATRRGELSVNTSFSRQRMEKKYLGFFDCLFFFLFFFLYSAACDTGGTLGWENRCVTGGNEGLFCRF